MTKKPAAEKAVSAVKAPLAVRPPATRKTTVRHTKAAAVPFEEPATPAVQTPKADSREAIAKIAYGYWESRGYQGGNHTEDWARAEAEYLATVA